MTTPTRALVEDKLGSYKDQWRRHWSAFNQAVAQAKPLPGGFADLIKSDWRPQVPGESAGASDLTALTAKQAFARLPRYLRWDPEDEDSLPFREKFFVVPLPPGEELREPLRWSCNPEWANTDSFLGMASDVAP
jgi:hypothetical protein